LVAEDSIWIFNRIETWESLERRLGPMTWEAIPPFKYVHEHFGYRDRLTTPEIEGTGVEPTPGSGPPIKAGEFILGYPDEDGPPPKLPQPEILSRNGSYMAYRRLRQHVAAFRDFLREARRAYRR
jgi:deferrochelatase/peroxidase EfeB